MGYCQQEAPNKSLHRAIQKAIQKALPEAIIEMPFLAIRRIADVAYPLKNVVYEVQCSPISLREVQKRNKDYARVGYTVIWILHDHCFNKKTLSSAELYLRHTLSYYTSITSYGSGFFYDQLEFFRESERVYKSCPLILKSLIPRSIGKQKKRLPKVLKHKLQKHSLYLIGDALDFLLFFPKKRAQICSFERALFPRPTLKTNCLKIFEALLKKAATQRETPF